MFRKDEIALKYQVSARTVGYWMSRKIIPYLKVGNIVRFDPVKVEAALAKHGVEASVKGGLN